MQHVHAYGPKTFKLRTGQDIVVRPVKPAPDLDGIVAFFSRLPPRSMDFLRLNLTDRERCRQRLAQLDDESHFRLVAELDGRIVGDASLDREPYAWTAHIASMRAVVAPEVQKLGIGSILFSELVMVAEDAHIERLVCEVTAEQKPVIKMLEKIGFHHEATLRGFIKDPQGAKHDMLIMTNELIAIWESLALELEAMDIRMSG